MSDPVKNVEIEDVLSSIRRLVTEDNRTAPPKVRFAGTRNADRLVLTPALRVPTADAVAESDSESGPSPDRNDDQSKALSLDAYRTDIPAETDDAPDEFLSDSKDDFDPKDDPAADALLSTDDASGGWAGTASDNDRLTPEPGPAIEFRAHARPATILNPEDGRKNVGLSDDQDTAGENKSEQAPMLNESQPWKNGDSFLFQAAQLARRTDAAKRDRVQDEQDASAADETEPTLTGRIEPDFEAKFSDEDAEFADDDTRTAQSDDGDSPLVAEGDSPMVDDGDTPLADDGDSYLATPEDGGRSENQADAPLSSEPETSETDTDLRAASLSAKIEALEAAIAETHDQWEPDGQGGDDYAGTKVDSIDWQHPNRDESGAHDNSADDVRADESHTDENHAKELHVVDDLNDDREVKASHADDRAEYIAPAEPTDSDTTDSDTTDIAPNDIEPAEPEPADFEPGDSGQPSETDAVPASDAAELSDLETAMPVLDDERLREMVAEIVREELQGALGERITRNVRKLVRREIQRALTAQQLE